MERIKIINEIDRGSGYVLASLSQDDFACFTDLIRANYERILIKAYPLRVEEIKGAPLSRYHELEIDKHKDLWTKEARTFSEDEVLIFRNSHFFRELEKCFGKISITNEDETRSEEIYWRLVRPNTLDDIGPLHADSWFWDLHYGKVDPKYRRIKAWISIWNNSGLNGFRLIPGSQLEKFDFEGEVRDGKVKPRNDPELEKNENLKLIDMNPGGLILFHDDLIHGGAIGGRDTRVSLEFTFLVEAI